MILTRMAAFSIAGVLIVAGLADAQQPSKPPRARNAQTKAGVAWAAHRATGHARPTKDKARPRHLVAHSARPAFKKAASPAVIESSHIDKKTGNLIALWVRPREDMGSAIDTVVVPCPYAMYIEWNDPRDDPQWAKHLMFVFYDNVHKKSYQTRSYLAFLNVVAAQPRNIEILPINACTASLDRRPGNERARLSKVLKAGNRRLKDEYCALIDTCAAEEFIYPGDRKARKRR